MWPTARFTRWAKLLRCADPRKRADQKTEQSGSAGFLAAKALKVRNIDLSAQTSGRHRHAQQRQQRCSEVGADRRR